MSKKIEITIDTRKAEVSMEAEGYRGRECQKDLNVIQEIIGGNTRIRKAKPELKRAIHQERLRNGSNNRK